MTRLMQESVYFRDVTSLLDRYGFESEGQSMEELVEVWAERYPSHWVRLAVVEALYQGRYKTVSVEQILAAWKRRGHALYHFNHEFERLIARKVPQKQQMLPACLNSSIEKDLEVVADPSYLVDTSSAVSDRLTAVEEKADRTWQSPATEETEQYLPDYIDEISSPAVYPEFNSLELPANDQIETSSLEEFNKRTIDRFTPKSDRSDIYLKLMALSGDANR